MNPGEGPRGGAGRGRGSGRHHQGPQQAPVPVPPAAVPPASVPDTLPPSAADDKPKFTLSAEAKEWYPANYMQSAPVEQNVGHYGGRQQHYHHHQHNNNQHYHHHQQQQHQYQPSYNRYHYQNRYSAQDRLQINHQPPADFELQDSIAQLISVMYEVTLNPGKFAVLAGPLVDSFSLTLDDVHHTRPLVDAIVIQAIGEPNFRYNGARLCLMFECVEPRPDAPSVFRKCLLERCAAEEEKIVAGGSNSQENICGFAMFLAELYTQLDNPEGGRIKELGESLCKVLKYLLTTPDSNGTKTICQILKLTGLALDADCRGHLDDIFEGLHAAERSGIQTLLVRNVINLRQQRWGSGGFAEMADIETPPADKHITPPIAQNGHVQTNRNNDTEGMFFLPDGHINLTSEERAFLNRHLPSDSNFLDDGDDPPDDLDNEVWDGEMSAEERKDFMDFLKMSNQIAR